MTTDQVRRTRLLLVTEHSFLGGEAFHILTFLDHLDRTRWVIEVCSAGEGFLVDEVRQRGVHHIPIALKSQFNLLALVQLARIFRRGHYDIVHLQGSRAGVLGRPAAKLAGVPVTIWTMHIFQADILSGRRSWLKPVYLLAERLLAHLCDHIITTSGNLRERAIRLGGICPDKITAIYNDNIDLRRYDIAVDVPAKRAELGLPADAPLVGTVGRLCVQKGMADFIRAAALVHREMPQVHFLIVGDGPLRPELETLTAELGLSPVLHFAGYRLDVPAIMFALDLFATATHWEGLGIVNIEAMLARRPLVSTAVGPIPEVVDGYRGALLVPPHDPPALAQALLTMLADLPAYARWGEQGRRMAQGRFGVEKQIVRTERLYEQLLAQKGRG
jgi:glycosyltransferase involved in cell wall biosynthesis